MILNWNRSTKNGSDWRRKPSGNINELLNSIKIFVEQRADRPDLSAYLDEISLLTDIDRWDPIDLRDADDAAQCKGLEFEVVIIAGLEDGCYLSPAVRKRWRTGRGAAIVLRRNDQAKERLYLVHAQTRHRFGREEFGSVFRNFPSRFLKEIPANFTQVFTSVQIV